MSTCGACRVGHLRWRKRSPLHDLGLSLQPRRRGSLQVGTEGSRTREDVAQRREVVLVDDGMFRNAENDRRHETRRRAAVLLHEVERDGQFELGQDAERATVVKREVENDLESENVIQWQDGEHRVLLIEEVFRLDRLLHARRDVEDREFDALRLAGRSRREREDCVGNRMKEKKKISHLCRLCLRR